MLELERPADLLARRAEREQRTAEQQRGDDGAGGIGEGFDLCAARVATRAREAQRFEAQYRENAGHQVEDQPAEDRATQRGDRKSVVEGKRVSVRVDLGG